MQIFLDVFSQDVGFEVDSIARLAVADVGMVLGVRDDGGFGDTCLVVPARDGKADAVNADGAFGDDVAAEIFRHAHAIPPVFAFLREMRYLAECVHMA